MQTITKIDSPLQGEGYVYVSYGKEIYLAHVIVSALTLRRYDRDRPIAIVCPQEHIDIIKKYNCEYIFALAQVLDHSHASIVGFKHHIHEHMPFEKNIFLDSDMIWCKDPNPLWSQLSHFGFTITGQPIADVYFGAPKGLSILSHILLNKRKRTMTKFGLTALPRVQSGFIYACDRTLTMRVCEKASEMLSRKQETHFQSRLNEGGRNMESCEWSLAMAMSALDVHVLPWVNGQESPQLDYISTFTKHDESFDQVRSLVYFDAFMYSLRGIPNFRVQRALLRLFGMVTGKSDHQWVTPYLLHFGWLHQKQPFLSYADKVWNQIKDSSHP